jgi:hypothetical protein
MNHGHRERFVYRTVIGIRREGEPVFPGSPSNSPSFLLSPPVGRTGRQP